jgi:hypothetical protein
MWIQSVINAMSQVDQNKLKRVISLNPDGDWSEEEWKEYNYVAGAVVEPFTFPGCESDEEDLFYEKSDEFGPDFVKSITDCLDNKDDWNKLIDLVDVIGY